MGAQLVWKKGELQVWLHSTYFKAHRNSKESDVFPWDYIDCRSSIFPIKQQSRKEALFAALEYACTTPTIDQLKELATNYTECLNP